MLETAENIRNKRSPLYPKIHARSIMSTQEISRLYAETRFIFIIDRCSINYRNNYFSLIISLPVFICQLSPLNSKSFESRSVKSRIYCNYVLKVKYQKLTFCLVNLNSLSSSVNE